MNAMENIRHRRSVRTFDTNPLKDEDVPFHIRIK